jgi:hypothetical protein
MRRQSIFRIGLACALAVFWVNTASAQLTLTGDGTSDGFSLSTFVSGFPSTPAGAGQFGSTTEIGPIGVAVNDGSVFVTNNANGGVYSFSDTDGQTAGSPLRTNGNALFGMTTVGVGANAATYAVGLSTNSLYQVFSDGTASSAGHLPGCDSSCIQQSEGDGITTVPTTISGSSPLTAGDLLVLNGNNSRGGAGIYDVPVIDIYGDLDLTSARKIVPFNSNVNNTGADNGLDDGDGIAVSPDGLYVYVAEGDDSVVAYSAGGDGTPIFTLTSGSSCTDGSAGTACVTGISGLNGADGISFIVGGTLANDFLVNTNYGELLLIDPDLAAPNLSSVTLIANCTGGDCSGDRGDFVNSDPSNGSLLVTQSTEIQRLSCTTPSTCGVFEGGPLPATVPEPSSLALFGAAVAGLRFFRRRKPVTG